MDDDIPWWRVSIELTQKSDHNFMTKEQQLVGLLNTVSIELTQKSDHNILFWPKSVELKNLYQ